MTTLLVIDTVVIALLAVFVVGLLRSHAEILRRLRDPAVSAGGESGDVMDPDIPPPPGGERARAAAVDIVGETPRGDVLKVAMQAGAPSTLLGFLSSGCATCGNFWSAFQPDERPPLPGDARLLLVTKDTTHESPTKLRKLAPPDVPVIMSSDAWRDYDVPVSPYFVYVDGASGEVYGEGAGSNWEQVASLLEDALDDEALKRSVERSRAEGGRKRAREGQRVRRARDRAARAERELSAAGIRPGHPSLYEDPLEVQVVDPAPERRPSGAPGAGDDR